MTYIIEDVTAETVAEILSRNPLQPFNEGDWQAFCGAMTETPRICYEENLVIILDGTLVQVIDYESEYSDFIDFTVDEIERLADNFVL